MISMGQKAGGFAETTRLDTGLLPTRTCISLHWW